MHTAQNSKHLFAYKYVVCINGPGVMSLHVSEVPGIEYTLVVVVREVLCSGGLLVRQILHNRCAKPNQPGI